MLWYTDNINYIFFYLRNICKTITLTVGMIKANLFFSPFQLERMQTFVVDFEFDIYLKE